MSADDALTRALQHAVDCINGGNLALADITCRQILSQLPGCAQAFGILGVIAAQLRLRDQGIEYFQQAISSDPSLASVRAHLNQVQNMPAQWFDLPSNQSERFLLIKAWGHGFWADVTHVLGALLLAEITGRTPVTHWGSNSLYCIDSNADAFQAYFEPVSGTDFNALLQLKGATFFPPKWTNANLQSDNNAKAFGSFSRMGALYFLNRPENIAVSDYFIGVVDVVPWIPKGHPLHGKSIDELLNYLTAKYICPKPYILKAVDEFERQHLGDGRTVAVHIRGSDKNSEVADLDEVNQSYFGLIDNLDTSWKILLLTDDTRFVDIFLRTYPDRTIVTEAQRSSNNVGIHHQGDHASLGFEIMRDTYLALRCQKFIGNGESSVSAMIAILKRWKTDECILIRPPAHLYFQNWYIYDPAFSG
jgi:protein O-GlcNAc transferase